MKSKFIIPTVVIFIMLSAIFLGLRLYVPEYQFTVLETANVVMLLLSVASYLMVQKQMGNNNTQAFVRGVSGASFLKLMVCMVAVLVYVLINRSNIHKPSVFIMFGTYAVYTATETILLSRLVRGNN